jgi:hypothetical protein
MHARQRRAVYLRRRTQATPRGAPPGATAPSWRWDYKIRTGAPNQWMYTLIHEGVRGTANMNQIRPGINLFRLIKKYYYQKNNTTQTATLITKTNRRCCAQGAHEAAAGWWRLAGMDWPGRRPASRVSTPPFARAARAMPCSEQLMIIAKLLPQHPPLLAGGFHFRTPRDPAGSLPRASGPPAWPRT